MERKRRQPDGAMAAAGAPPEGEDPSDDEVAARAAAGDAAALEELYGRYGARCYGLARRIVVDAQLAQDVVQDVFLALWRQGRHDPGRGAVATWLLSITHHRAVDRVRKEERRRLHATSLDELRATADRGPSPEELAWRSVRGEAVRAAMANLPAEQREVLLLAYYGGYTQSEIASMSGVPIGTVKTRTLAALRKLAKSLPGLAPADDETTGERP
jgi:RNA polymerase sigma-70 factor (ECF subfamily)